MQRGMQWRYGRCLMQDTELGQHLIPPLLNHTTMGDVCRYYRPDVYKMLEAHRRRQLSVQELALSEAQNTIQEVLEERLGPEGMKVNVQGKVRSIFSMYKGVKVQISSKLAGTPIEDVPDEKVCSTGCVYNFHSNEHVVCCFYLLVSGLSV